MTTHSSPPIPLPKSWTTHVRDAVLHIISLAQFATAYTRGWAANSINPRLRRRAEVDRLTEEVAVLKEELRIKDARMAAVPARRRPHYAATDRMAILELKAARGWSARQTADRFLVTDATIASWVKRVDDDTLVQIAHPVNRFPDLVRYAVQRLKLLCPAMGKVKIAQTLCRAGLHLGATTVGRILKERPQPKPAKVQTSDKGRTIVANSPNHVWHVDLTTVPIGGGFWASWLPFALPQCWPFCWWVVVVVDHYSRRVLGVGVFPEKPACRAVCAFLGRTLRNGKPKYIICDRDSIFDCAAFRRWVKRRGIKPPRYGAIGKHGSIAVVERMIKTLKVECARRILVPMKRKAFRREMVEFVDWYNEHRPHMTLAGRTPNEVFFRRRPANRRPRLEPRACWPRSSPCTRPQTLVAGQPGDRFALRVDFPHGRRHLPVVTLRRAA